MNFIFEIIGKASCIVIVALFMAHAIAYFLNRQDKKDT